VEEYSGMEIKLAVKKQAQLYLDDLKHPDVTEVWRKTIKLAESEIVILAAYRDWKKPGGDKVTSSVTANTVSDRGSRTGAILISVKEVHSVESAEKYLKDLEKAFKVK